jgi:hypothetical protein
MAAAWRTDRRTGWSDLVEPSTDPAPFGRIGDRPGPAGDRPGLTVITGEGGTGPAARRIRPPVRAAHLRAVSGEQYRGGDADH